MCAAAYVDDSQAFTARVLADVIVVALGGLLQDCNTASNPEGISGREWCYVEVRAQSDVLSAPSKIPFANAGTNRKNCFTEVGAGT